MDSVSAAAVDPVQQHSMLQMVMGSGPVVMSVLIILVLLSIGSWAITIAKTLQFRRAKLESEAFSSIFWQTRNLARVDDSTKRLSSSPLVQVFASGYRELSHVMQEGGGHTKGRSAQESELGTVERALRRAEYEEALKLERGITFLAT
ncbi:MAG: hypothetical protein DCC75_07330, partial [Proteobacteria bacterium]